MIFLTEKLYTIMSNEKKNFVLPLKENILKGVVVIKEIIIIAGIKTGENEVTLQEKEKTDSIYFTQHICKIRFLS